MGQQLFEKTESPAAGGRYGREINTFSQPGIMPPANAGSGLVFERTRAWGLRLRLRPPRAVLATIIPPSKLWGVFVAWWGWMIYTPGAWLWFSEKTKSLRDEIARGGGQRNPACGRTKSADDVSGRRRRAPFLAGLARGIQNPHLRVIASSPACSRSAAECWVTRKKTNRTPEQGEWVAACLGGGC